MIGILKKLGFYLKNKKTIYLVESEEDEEFVKESLEEEKYIGIDTEFNWRNTYFPELSLLQISTSSKILLIDDRSTGLTVSLLDGYFLRFRSTT